MTFKISKKAALITLMSFFSPLKATIQTDGGTASEMVESVVSLDATPLLSPTPLTDGPETKVNFFVAIFSMCVKIATWVWEQGAAVKLWVGGSVAKGLLVASSGLAAIIAVVFAIKWLYGLWLGIAAGKAAVAAAKFGAIQSIPFAAAGGTCFLMRWFGFGWQASLFVTAIVFFVTQYIAIRFWNSVKEDHSVFGDFKKIGSKMKEGFLSDWNKIKSFRCSKSWWAKSALKLLGGAIAMLVVGSIGFVAGKKKSE